MKNSLQPSTSLDVFTIAARPSFSFFRSTRTFYYNRNSSKISILVDTTRIHSHPFRSCQTSPELSWYKRSSCLLKDCLTWFQIPQVWKCLHKYCRNLNGHRNGLYDLLIKLQHDVKKSNSVNMSQSPSPDYWCRNDRSSDINSFILILISPSIVFSI